MSLELFSTFLINCLGFLLFVFTDLQAFCAVKNVTFLSQKKDVKQQRLFTVLYAFTQCFRGTAMMETN